jgi:glyoxylase-like metal-dependent hydrolase (beta-lactamase superfamily II)
VTRKQIGDVVIETIVELDGPLFEPARLFPEWTSEILEQNRDWMAPRHYDLASGLFVMPVQSFLIKTAHHTILVDGCFGNHKERANPNFNMLDTPWLKRLAATGTTPDDIDFVMCTHLHGDHVGWNTRLDCGRWVPTFPNATYLFAEAEWRHWDNESRRSGGPLAPHLEDSVLPVIDTGQAQFVGMDHEIEDGLVFEPLPGHTPGHVGLHVRSRGRAAILTGDMIHHPIQLVHQDLCSGFCHAPSLARATRRRFLETYVDTDVLVAPAHFPAPTFGLVRRAGNVFRYQFDGE